MKVTRFRQSIEADHGECRCKVWNLGFLIPLALTALWSQLALAQTRAHPPRSGGRGAATIRGRVFDAATSQGLSGVQVRANPMHPTETGRGAGTSTTKADGRYEITNLPAGTYTVIASSPTYLRTSFGEQLPLGPGRRMTLAEGQILERIDLRLMHEGVIAGRVVNESGSPIAGVSVVPRMYQPAEGGGRRLVEIGFARTQTNALGEYQISRLRPGEYCLFAAMQTFASEGQQTADPTAYAPTLYPGVRRIADAQPLAIAPGDSISSIDFTLPAAPTARISGTAIDAQGHPIAGASIIASTELVAAGSYTRGDGTFVIKGLTPGAYTVRTAIIPGTRLYNASAHVVVDGTDITDLRLLSTKTSISGRVTFEPGGTPPPFDAIHIWTYRSEYPGSSDVDVTVNADATFEMPVLPGHVYVRASPVEPDWRLHRVLLDGKDVTDVAVEVPVGRTLDVVVELTNHVYPIIGKVTAPGVASLMKRLVRKGGFVRDCQVIVFGQNRNTWSPGTRYLAADRPGVDGLFHALLPAGDYFAIAMPDVEPGVWSDPAFLAKARRGAVKLTVAEGNRKPLSLPLRPVPR